MPWQRERLTPADLKALMEGRRWRRSRDLEVLAMALIWIRGAWGAEDEYEKVVSSLPGYDGEHGRAEKEARAAGLKRMRAKKAKKRA